MRLQHDPLRIDASVPVEAVERALAAATTVGTQVHLTVATETGNLATGAPAPATIRGAVVERDAALAERIGGYSRLRLLTSASDELRRAAHAAGVPVDDAPIAATAAVELPRWLRQQAVSETLHRYGNVRRGA